MPVMVGLEHVNHHNNSNVSAVIDSMDDFVWFEQNLENLIGVELSRYQIETALLQLDHKKHIDMQY